MQLSQKTSSKLSDIANTELPYIALSDDILKTCSNKLYISRSRKYSKLRSTQHKYLIWFRVFCIFEVQENVCFIQGYMLNSISLAVWSSVGVALSYIVKGIFSRCTITLDYSQKNRYVLSTFIKVKIRISRSYLISSFVA